MIQKITKWSNEMTTKEMRERIKKLQWAVLGDIVIIVLLLFIIAYLIKS